MTCPCEGQNPADLREAVKCVEPTLFHRVERPASLGDDTVTPADQLNYRNVLLVYQANGHAYLYSSDGIPTFISYTKSDADISKLEEAIAELQTDLANETLNRNEADEGLQAQIDTNITEIGQNTNRIVDLEEATVLEDITVSGDDSTVTLTKAKKHLNSINPTEVAMPLPVASEEAAGVMNPATFKAVQENAENIDSILGGAVLIEGLPADITQDSLTQTWKDATGKTELINRASIFDTDNNRVWYYYENAHEWKPISTDGTEVTVSIATNDTPGIVKGSTEDGQVAVEADGSMSLNGYDGMQHDIENLSQLVAGIEVPKVPEYVAGLQTATDYDPWSFQQDANGLWLRTSFYDIASGVKLGSRARSQVPIATTTRNGVMSATDKSKLDNFPPITSIGENLELTDEGVLNATSGEIEVPKVKRYIIGSDTLTPTSQLQTFTTAYDGGRLELEYYLNNTTTGSSVNRRVVVPNATSQTAGAMAAADKSKLDAIPTLTEMQWTRTTNLPPAVVTGFEDTTYGADTITMHLDTKDLATGGVSVQELELDGAVANTAEAGGHAGLMTAFQATQLAALAEGGAGGGQLTADEVTKVQNLGTGSLTNMEGVTQTEETVEIEFARQNLVAGGATTQTATIAAATTEEAGVMTPAMVIQLNQIGDVATILETLTTGTGV